MVDALFGGWKQPWLLGLFFFFDGLLSGRDWGCCCLGRGYCLRSPSPSLKGVLKLILQMGFPAP